MNLVILKGHCGQDPKITNFSDGGKVANFSLATTERGFKTKDGKDIPDVTTWHNIVIKKTGLAKFCEEKVKKGTAMFVTGKITNRSYEDNGGQTRYITEIVVDELELLGNGNKESKQDDKPF